MIQVVGRGISTIVNLLAAVPLTDTSLQGKLLQILQKCGQGSLGNWEKGMQGRQKRQFILMKDWPPQPSNQFIIDRCHHLDKCTQIAHTRCSAITVVASLATQSVLFTVV